tara:strand:+ start:2011 stop:2781 length:771 start_codon:yes stop_codon:yes gene_type:complete
MNSLTDNSNFSYFINRVNGFYVARYNGFYFESVFQSVVNDTGECMGFEALVRIKCLSTGENINPHCFFRSIESDVDATNFGIICCCIHLRNFTLSQYRGVKLFLNVSPSIFSALHRQPQVMEDIIYKLSRGETGLDQIVLEVTEFDDKHVSDLVSGVNKFRKHGINIAVDDFGVGFSNESRVHILKPDYIKLDKSLLDNYMDHQAPQLADAIMFSKNSGATIIAEGVETKEQMSVLKDMGVEFMQGYYWGRPHPLV